MDGEFWFAVHTQAQREALASWHLTRLGYETFWPHTWEQVKAATPRWVKRSWYSRYLFVRTVREKIYGVNEAWGVSAVVYAAGSEPYPIPDGALENLMGRADAKGEIQTGKLPQNIRKCKVGDEIHVEAEKNPLFGFYLVVKETLDNGTLRAMFPNYILGSSEITIRESDVSVVSSKAEQKPLTIPTATSA